MDALELEGRGDGTGGGRHAAVPDGHGASFYDDGHALRIGSGRTVAEPAELWEGQARASSAWWARLPAPLWLLQPTPPATRTWRPSSSARANFSSTWSAWAPSACSSPSRRRGGCTASC